MRPAELQMAGSLIETLSADFDPTQFTDGYREALQAVIDAKVEGHDVIAPAGRRGGQRHRGRPDGRPARQRRRGQEGQACRRAGGSDEKPAAKKKRGRSRKSA